VSYEIKGLWIGGAISVEAAEEVERAILIRTTQLPDGPLRFELHNLANAVRAEIQRVPKPVCDLI